MKMRGYDRCSAILATDLDGTLVGYDEGYYDLIRYLHSLPEKVHLAYITGRHYDSAVALIEEQKLQQPDFLITDVGAVIRAGDLLTVDETWQKRMSEKWRPQEIKRIGNTVTGLSEQVIPHDCRVSFFSENRKAAESCIQKLKKAKIPHTFIYSADRYIDILPEKSGKGAALRYLIDRYAMSGAKVLAAGDSGNDTAMITAGYPAVIVSNAQADLKSLPENPLIYRASQPCAAGILEAWKYFYDPQGR